MKKQTLIKERLRESIAVKERIIANESLMNMIADLSEKIVHVIESGNKLVLCGNGGSASDALHFAGEIVGRFQKERSGWPAVVLNADVATMTAVANDYGYENVFARQAEGHVRPGDLFFGITTSGNSGNVIRAAIVAKEKGAYTAGLLGKDGGKMKDIVDYPIVVACNNTARVQESHICIIHILCELIENGLTSLNDQKVIL